MLLARLTRSQVTPSKSGDDFEAGIPHLEKVQVRSIEERQKKVGKQIKEERYSQL